MILLEYRLLISINMIFLNYFITLSILFLIILYFKNKRTKIGNSFKVFDHPNKFKIHKNSTPLTAAYSLFVIIIILSIYLYIKNESNFLQYIAFSSFPFLIIGYLDDRFNLNAYLKLLIFTVVLILFLLQFENF